MARSRRIAAALSAALALAGCAGPGPSGDGGSWGVGEPFVTGDFADAEAIDLGGGGMRVYYAVTGRGLPSRILSRTSADGGRTWADDEGERLSGVAFPDVVALPDGRWRMYFQGNDPSGGVQGAIGSAISRDGLRWTLEAGARIEQRGHDPAVNVVGAPGVARLADGSWLMAYRGDVPGRYSSRSPNDVTHVLFWATSADGLAWERRGVALDGRSDRFGGLLDGCELVLWEGGEVRMHFWTGSPDLRPGIYHVVFTGEGFTKEPVVDLPGDDRLIPADPTFAGSGASRRLFYGIGPDQGAPKGIYEAKPRS